MLERADPENGTAKQKRPGRRLSFLGCLFELGYFEEGCQGRLDSALGLNG